MKQDTKMYMINEDGSRIEKIVPPELYSNYIGIGWKVVETKPIETKPLTSNKSKTLNSEEVD